MKSDVYLWNETYFLCESVAFCTAGERWQRDVGCLIFIGHFPQRSPIICHSFTERDLQFKASYASSSPCMRICTSSRLTQMKNDVYLCKVTCIYENRPTYHPVCEPTCTAKRLTQMKNDVYSWKMTCIYEKRPTYHPVCVPAQQRDWHKWKMTYIRVKRPSKWAGLLPCELHVCVCVQ